MRPGEAAVAFAGSPAEATPFVLFGPTHLATLALVVAAVVLLPAAGRRWPPAVQRRVAVGLALVLVVGRFVDTALRKLAFGVPIHDQLPLHLCGMLAFVCAWMLWRQSYATF
ncbi:MAG TPA: hypothetical protein VKU40_09390, partial [Thermoanaerobaculia bacterium]|nr:hypothetical protein [Thermoanaerobaculia bacterium]